VVTWLSANPSSATISNAAGSRGLATASSVGSTDVTATLGSVSETTSLTVTSATLVSIAVTPAAPVIANGTMRQFTATGTYSDNSTQDLTATVAWYSTDSAVATISNAPGSRGLATASSVGSTSMTATSGAISGSTPLTVTSASLVSIEITPANPSIKAGETLAFSAVGTFTDATMQDLTSLVTWNSSAPATATISNASGSHGLVVGLASGPVLISASSGLISSSTTLTVTAPSVAFSLQVDDGRSYVSAGDVVTYVVTVTNNGALSNTTAVSTQFSGASDTVHLHWACINISGVVCSTSGSGPLVDAVTLGPAQSASWFIVVPILTNSPEDTVDVHVSATGATPVDDDDLLAIFRSGFE
jgi:hypothetical protein